MELQPGMMVTASVRLTRLLGRGGMGSVWAAHHLALNSEVAVKFIIPTDHTGPTQEALTRFQREASAAAQLASPHVVRVFDLGVMHDGTPYIVMEMLKGESLKQRLKRGPLELSELITVVSHAAKGLADAHRAGIIHRDIKPDNIFLTQVADELFVKVLDFGIAKQQSAPPSMATQTGSTLGTPHYMSPEQVRSARSVDPRSDLWSLGVVAYRALTSKLPFVGETYGALALEICGGEFQPPSELRPGLPRALDAWFARALSIDPNQRFQTARELMGALQVALGQSPPSRPSMTSVHEVAADVPTTVMASPDRPSAIPGANSGTFAGSATTSSTLYDFRNNSTVVVVGAVAAGLALVSLAVFIFGGDDETTREVAEEQPSADVHVPAAKPSSSASPLPADMVVLDAGKYEIGCDELDRNCWDDERPRHTVNLPRLAIMKHEVTVADYRACVEGGGCPKPPAKEGCVSLDPSQDAFPMNCVGWDAAKKFCQSRGARLPSEAEWEVAARGMERPDYPWGNEAPSCRLTVVADARSTGCGSGAPLRVGSRKRDVSWLGVFDLGGSMREWTSSTYAAYPGGKADEATLGKKVTRGGSWIMKPDGFATSHTRGGEDPDRVRTDLGFRCVKAL